MNQKAITATDKPAPGLERAVFGGGCFWCIEAVFQRVKGVKEAVSGYAGGHTKDPTYEQVCTHTTGHAEVVLIDFDPKVTSYEKLLDVFWHAHNPTQLNRQGNDALDPIETTKQHDVFVQELNNVIQKEKYLKEAEMRSSYKYN